MIRKGLSLLYWRRLSNVGICDQAHDIVAKLRDIFPFGLCFYSQFNRLGNLIDWKLNTRGRHVDSHWLRDCLNITNGFT